MRNEPPGPAKSALPSGGAQLARSSKRNAGSGFSPSIRIAHDSTGVVTLTLTRAERHNAFDDRMIAELTDALEHLASDDSVRVLILAAEGKSFSAGADLEWMRKAAQYSQQQNLSDARALAKLMSTLNSFPKPTIAQIQGAAYGGGVGLIAGCDIAIAAEEAAFCLSEVRLGLIPAVISPYVLRAIGERAARRYFLTAERFSAQQALLLGLIHKVVPGHQLAAAVAEEVELLLKGQPNAQIAAKKLVADTAYLPITSALIDETAQRIAQLRTTDEAKSAITAFLEKAETSVQRSAPSVQHATTNQNAGAGKKTVDAKRSSALRVKQEGRAK